MNKLLSVSLLTAQFLFINEAIFVFTKINIPTVQAECKPIATIVSLKGKGELTVNDQVQKINMKGKELCKNDKIQITGSLKVEIKCSNDRTKKELTIIDSFVRTYQHCPSIESPDSGIYRGSNDRVISDNGQPNIISPREKILQGQNILLLWDEIKGVENYTLFIKNDADEVIWTGEKIKGNKYNLTDKDIKLTSGKIYLLTVLSGDAIKEAKAQFWIIKETEASKIKTNIDSEKDVMKKVSIYAANELFSDAIELLEKQENKSYSIYKYLAYYYYILNRIDKAKANYELALQAANKPEETKFVQGELNLLQELIKK